MVEFKFALRDGLDERWLPKKDLMDTGYDVCSAEDLQVVLQPFQKAFIKLGFRMFCPEGCWMELRPRSSTFAKKHLNALYGVIDEGYENEVMFACQYIPPPISVKIDDDCWKKSIDWNQKLIIKPGDKIGQLVPVKRPDVNVVSISNKEYNSLCNIRNGSRGTGGFGSTGQ
jgi:dUTPase